MIILRRGDRLPSVAVVQYFLNLYGNQTLEADGFFGDITFEALRQFQTDNRLNPSGEVRNATWQMLNRRNWQIIDSVDATDPDVTDQVDFQSFGGTPIANYGMSNGVRRIADQIRARGQNGKVILLRFHGHGSPGSMSFSEGTDYAMGSSLNTVDYAANYWSGLGGFLRPIFSPMGCVEFHGCNVGQGAQGRLFLRRVANALNVPASAGVPSQFGGGSASLRFEGWVRTICPNGVSLRDWARQATNRSHA